jgi:serine/threonine-protein kinase
VSPSSSERELPLPAAPGEVLAGKYRITRLVGAGGMGTVYEAQHAVLGRRFAVKLLHPELARQQDLLERFRREAQAAGSLENENIASIIDFGHREDGIPFIVMELLVGEDLSKLLAHHGPLPVARAVNVVIQACRGLDAAHAAGIIHRDLKPENLFVCKRGDGSDLVKILDFGIAKLGSGLGDGPMSAVTRTGSTLGTPFYMPPEQARGEKTLDHRADIYALGVILYEALTGEKPHPGDSYNAILYHILTQAPAPLASLRPTLPPDLAEAVHGALAFDPGDRPASAMELARAIAKHAGRQVTPVQSQFELRVTRPAAAAAAGAGRHATPGAAGGGPGAARSGRAVRRAGVAAVVAAAGLGAAFWLARGREHAAGPGAPPALSTSAAPAAQAAHPADPGSAGPLIMPTPAPAAAPRAEIAPVLAPTPAPAAAPAPVSSSVARGQRAGHPGRPRHRSDGAGATANGGAAAPEGARREATERGENSRAAPDRAARRGTSTRPVFDETDPYE